MGGMASCAPVIALRGVEPPLLRVELAKVVVE